jgi:hypothetical protein
VEHNRRLDVHERYAILHALRCTQMLITYRHTEISSNGNMNTADVIFPAWPGYVAIHALQATYSDTIQVLVPQPSSWEVCFVASLRISRCAWLAERKFVHSDIISLWTISLEISPPRPWDPLSKRNW